MASTLIDNLGQEIDRIAAAYESGFAGQSRASRDLGELDRLLQRIKAVLAQVNTIPAAAQGPELVALREVAETNMKIYETERRAIQDAKAAGPDFEAFSRLATTANFVFARYYRDFAGRDRSTRDTGLMNEMVEDLKATRQRMSAIAAKNEGAAFRRDVELVTKNLEMYQGELKEITKAQATGSTDDQANLLANLANTQFNIYRNQFANNSRVTRRPALLQRMIDTLRRLRNRMNAMREGGFAPEFHIKNLEVVDANLQMYETELVEIRKARQGTSMADIMGMLGGNANELFEEYRQNFGGKDRSTVDLERLGLICDKLGELGRQMVELSGAEHSVMNEQNLDIVYDQLGVFEREYEAIAQVQRAGKPAAQPQAAPSP